MKKKRTKKVTNKISTSNPEWITYQLPQPCVAKYLVVVVDRGMAGEVNYFDSLEEAKRIFEEIAHDYGYKPEEINGFDKYDVSIWEWTEDRYERFAYTYKHLLAPFLKEVKRIFILAGTFTFLGIHIWK